MSKKILQKCLDVCNKDKYYIQTVKKGVIYNLYDYGFKSIFLSYVLQKFDIIKDCRIKDKYYQIKIRR